MSYAGEALHLTIQALTSTGLSMAVLSCWDEAPEDPEEVKLRIEIDNRCLEVRSGNGYFQALFDLRAQLEPDGILLVCYGASENVYPSPMIQSMGCGEKAYRLTMGVQARTQDLVSIFDSGPDVTPTTTANQRRYYELWLKSLL